jgi:transcriptional regulator with XRE-family HTH domain
MTPKRPGRAASNSPPKDGRTAEPNVGAHLRLLRQERGLTLADLATMCGVSRAMLSQIEQGRSSPSIALGWKIANGLGLPFGALLGEPTESDFLVQRASQVREVFSPDRALQSRALFPGGDRRAPELYELVLRPGGVEEAQAHALGTRELLYLGAGTLVLSSAGHRVELTAGDSLFFRADQPHRYENPGQTPTHCFLVMCYPSRPTTEATADPADSPAAARGSARSPVPATAERRRAK